MSSLYRHFYHTGDLAFPHRRKRVRCLGPGSLAVSPSETEAYLGLGNARRARELANEAIQTATQLEMPVAEVHAHLASARILIALDGVAAQAAIESTLDRALALVQSTGARSYEPRACPARGPTVRHLRNAAVDTRGTSPLHRDGRYRTRRAAGEGTETVNCPNCAHPTSDRSPFSDVAIEANCGVSNGIVRISYPRVIAASSGVTRTSTSMICLAPPSATPLSGGTSE